MRRSFVAAAVVALRAIDNAGWQEGRTVESELRAQTPPFFAAPDRPGPVVRRRGHDGLRCTHRQDFLQGDDHDSGLPAGAWQSPRDDGEITTQITTQP